MTRPIVVTPKRAKPTTTSTRYSTTSDHKQWAALVKLDKEEHSAEDAEWALYLARERTTSTITKIPVQEDTDIIENVISSQCYCP
jgi:hypothetical protein